MSRFLPPEDGSGRDSAVLIALSDGADGPAVLLIQRAATLRDHAGQVAFPGGAVDPDDADATAAALREATEEVGLDPAARDRVRPVARRVHPGHRLRRHARCSPGGTSRTRWRPVDPVEVARAVIVPIAELTDPANRFRVRHPSGWIGPGFEVAGLFVWGFTAGLLDSVLTLAGWATGLGPRRRAAAARALPRPHGQ